LQTIAKSILLVD